MKMSIDEAIESLENMRALVGANHFAINMAVDTMRKYQKIEDIMHIEMNGKEALQEIERILRG